MLDKAPCLSRSLGALFDTGVVDDLPDRQLLEQFTASDDRDELLFDALVERHGPMVLRVCCRLLDDTNDAEDAFQATFLVLLRHARSIRHMSSLAAWLYGVALRVASWARVDSARRRRIERHVIRQATERNAEPDRQDLRAMIDFELARLPEKYREPIVLCYLEELTHEGAAERLGWPVGTVPCGAAWRGQEISSARG
jgi:polysaccharide biosynthesis/export protein